MNDKINGIIVDGRIYTNNFKAGSCDDCDLFDECMELWTNMRTQYCDIIDDDRSIPFLFSQELTDKLNGK